MSVRGLRNNNPGNIRKSNERYQGEVRPSLDPAFKQFISMAYGYRALMRVLKTYYNKYGLRSVRGMINRWAPKNENDTNGYISFVAGRMGIDADKTLEWDKPTLTAMAAAISRMENGVEANRADVEEGWTLLEGK